MFPSYIYWNSAKENSFLKQWHKKKKLHKAVGSLPFARSFCNNSYVYGTGFVSQLNLQNDTHRQQAVGFTCTGIITLSPHHHVPRGVLGSLSFSLEVPPALLFWKAEHSAVVQSYVLPSWPGQWWDVFFSATLCTKALHQPQDHPLPELWSDYDSRARRTVRLKCIWESSKKELCESWKCLKSKARNGTWHR